MILGRVTDDEAVVTLTVADARGEAHEVEFVVDTGFTGHLTLRRTLVDQLGLVQADEEEVFLADGSTTVLALYRVTVDWLDEPRVLTAYAVDSSSLIGMKLLRGSLLTLEVIDDGTVTIEPAE